MMREIKFCLKRTRYVLLCIFCANLFGVESSPLLLDTYISQEYPASHFENRKYIEISNKKDKQSISFIPFKAEPIDIAFLPAQDEIFMSKLVLCVKVTPELVSYIDKLKEQIKNELNLQENKDDEGEKSKDSEPINKEKFERKIKISVYGLVNQVAFFDLNGDYKVSWNGENDRLAPSHNGVDSQLDTSALFLLGELTIDLLENEWEDGDKVEFESDSLNDYLNYAYASEYAKKKDIAFARFLPKLDVFTIILKQNTGFNPIQFYSANSFKDKNADNYNVDEENEAESETDEEKQVDLRPKLVMEFTTKASVKTD